MAAQRLRRPTKRVVVLCAAVVRVESAWAAKSALGAQFAVETLAPADSALFPGLLPTIEARDGTIPFPAAGPVMSLASAAGAWLGARQVYPLEADDPGQIGAYRLLGRLGEGGMGKVFLGASPGGRKVAVKLIRPEYADNAEFRQRFAREVAAARQVGGFHTALVVDADPDADPPWMVTSFIPGPSLGAQVAEHGPLDPAEVYALGAALAEGLAAVHACGLVHRDLKPGNIILAGDGPRIIDFGIARSATATTITETGTAIGTVPYMSPEHLGAGEIVAASDVFCLGAVLTFAAIGHAPFDAPQPSAVIGRILTQPPDLSPLTGSLHDIISDCLEKDPHRRPSLDSLLASFGNVHPATPDARTGPGRNTAVRDHGTVPAKPKRQPRRRPRRITQGLGLKTSDISNGSCPLSSPCLSTPSPAPLRECRSLPTGSS
jgi:serine/threonine protein kinase